MTVDQVRAGRQQVGRIGRRIGGCDFYFIGSENRSEIPCDSPSRRHSAGAVHNRPLSYADFTGLFSAVRASPMDQRRSSVLQGPVAVE